MCMGTSLSEAQPVFNREMKQTASIFETLWICEHGRPVHLAYDPEFGKAEFLQMLHLHGITPKPRPARRHNKLGRVERKHATIKLFLDRLLLENPAASNHWLVKQAIFLSNVLVGNQRASSFELVRGYTPSLIGSEMLKVPRTIIQAHKDLVAKRALNRILKTKAVTPTAPKILTPGTPIYGHIELKKGYKKWHPYTVLKCDGHTVKVRAAKHGPAKLFALEDVRLQPTNSLAKALSRQELNIPEPPATEDVENEEETPAEPIIQIAPPINDSEEESSIIEAHQPSFSQQPVRPEEGPDEPAKNLECTDTNTPEEKEKTDEELQEESKFSQSPEHKERPRRSQRQHRTPARYRDTLASNHTRLAADKTRTLQSNQQSVLEKLYNVHGSEQFTKGSRQDIPEWLYTKAIREELNNWDGHYDSHNITEIPPDSNVVGSHLVYRFKQNDEGTYKFKARLVVHGNEDLEKEEIRKDAATAHLATVRLILSMAVCYGLHIGKIDIKAAYFQSGTIKRRIYIRPPRELLLFKTLWYLLSLPYGIVEAGRQWQLVSDDFSTQSV